jgi:hypothetical protein
VPVSVPADLSGTSHEVFSGVALLYPAQGSQGGKPEECCFVEMTKVNFAPLEDTTIKAYVASGEPMDKAGGYGIQVSASILPRTRILQTGLDSQRSSTIMAAKRHPALFLVFDLRRKFVASYLLCVCVWVCVRACVCENTEVT